MIEVEGLTRYYGPQAAVRDVSFQVNRGDIVGFLGPNGAGKTTTMRMLTCFLPPSSGIARVAGFDVMDHPFEVRQRIGYLPESVPVYTDLAVGSYLELVADLKSVPRAGRRLHIAGIMDECGISDVQRRRIGTLSRGYRQRVGIAQALVGTPDVLILDEPTVGLDPRQIIEIRQLIRELAGERTVILSTHILPEVELICRRVVVIHRGQIVGDDTVGNLGSSVTDRIEIDVTIQRCTPGLIDIIARIAGVASVATESEHADATRLRIAFNRDADPRAQISAAIVQSAAGLVELRSRAPSLEDIFVRLVTGKEAGDA